MAFSLVDFPNLHPGNHRITSPPDKAYNCIAWALGIDNAPREPMTASGHYTTTALIDDMQSFGFVLCADGSLEDGVEKIAIYTDGPEYMHAARQLDNGKWTSKIGELEDIEHDTPEDVAGPAYGQPTAFMKRPRNEP